MFSWCMQFTLASCCSRCTRLPYTYSYAPDSCEWRGYQTTPFYVSLSLHVPLKQQAVNQSQPHRFHPLRKKRGGKYVVISISAHFQRGRDLLWCKQFLLVENMSPVRTVVERRQLSWGSDAAFGGCLSIFLLIWGAVYSEKFLPADPLAPPEFEWLFPPRNQHKCSSLKTI